MAFPCVNISYFPISWFYNIFVYIIKNNTWSRHLTLGHRFKESGLCVFMCKSQVFMNIYPVSSFFTDICSFSGIVYCLQ